MPFFQVSSVAGTNGCHATKRRTQKSVRIVKVLIGIALDKMLRKARRKGSPAIKARLPNHSKTDRCQAACACSLHPPTNFNRVTLVTPFLFVRRAMSSAIALTIFARMSSGMM